MTRADVFDALAELLEYPGDGHERRAARARAVLVEQAPDLAARLAPFLGRLTQGGPAEAEELYTRTFDWSPERALEVGWHLYGEQYDRGAFLVRMRELLRAHGVEEGAELPDRLGTLLRLLGRLPADGACDLAARALRPGLERMQAGFASEPDNPYRAVLEAVAAVLPPAAAPTRPAPSGTAAPGAAS